MVTNLTTNGGSSFKIRRPIITTSGFVSDIDGTVKDQLDKVEKLLKKKIFKVTAYSDPEEPDTIDSSSEKTTKTLGKEEKSAESFAKEGIAAAAARRARERVRAVPDPRKLLAAPLTPKRVPGDTWASGSLLYQLKAAPEAEENISLSDFIDMTADLSALKYGLQSALAESWFTLDSNTKAVLEDYQTR